MGQNLHAVTGRSIEDVLDRKVFRKLDEAAFEIQLYPTWRALAHLDGISLAHHLKVAQRVSRVEFQMKRQPACGLQVISFRTKRDREERFKLLYWQLLRVLYIEPLGSIRTYRKNLRAE